MSSKPRIDISYRRIAQIIAPVLVAEISYTMMGVIDTVMVGRLGVTALAAVGLGNFLTLWLVVFGLGLLHGVTPLVAQAVGAKEPRAAGVAFWQGIYLGLLFAAGLAAAWPLVPWILHWTGASPEATEIANDYMQVRLLGGLGFALVTVAGGLYRGVGRTTILIASGFVQLALNCGLNYLLIFGKLGAPRLGASGAAWGTVLSQLIVGLVLAATILLRKGNRELEARSAWRFERQVSRTLFRLSLPIAVQYFLGMGGITVFFALIARLGDAEMAATNAVIQIWSIAYMGGIALAAGSTTLVGQSIGAGHPEDGRLAVKRVLNLGYGLSAISAVVYLTVPESLMAIFVREADLGRLLPFARPLFVIVSICLVFDLIFEILSGALRGAGDTKYPMWVNIGCAWLLFVPATVIATPLFGLLGAWACLILFLVSMAVLLQLRFRRETWWKPPLQQAAAGSGGRAGIGDRLRLRGDPRTVPTRRARRSA